MRLVWDETNAFPGAIDVLRANTKPVLLYSGGKDSACLAHLAHRATVSPLGQSSGFRIRPVRIRPIRAGKVLASLDGIWKSGAEKDP